MGLPSLTPSVCIGKSVQVYALIDPRSQTAFYVGATTRRLGQRLSSHRNDAIKLGIATKRCEVIRAIEADGHRAGIGELETVAFDEWVEAEQFWIGYLQSIGARLTNLAIGGAGATGSRQTAETQRRRSEAAKGRDMSIPHSPQARERAASRLRHVIVVDGVRFDGIAVAARALGISHGLVHRRVDLGQYQRVTPRKNGNTLKLKGRPTGDDHHNSKPIEIDGVRYASMKAAMSSLGISRQQARKATRL